MRTEAPAVELVSGERIGGGIAADGMGELSKLLLGVHPAKALRIACDTGVLVQLLPEFERSLGFDQESRYHSLPVDEHTFRVVQAAADQRRSLTVRLATVFHDLGKPHVAWRGTDNHLHYYPRPGYSRKSHEQVSAELAERALSRLRYPTEIRRRVVRIVRLHMLDTRRSDPVRARRLLSRYGEALVREILDHREADLYGKDAAPSLEELERLRLLREAVARERKSPYRVRDLAVDGNDLIQAGFTPGPALGRALAALLEDVIKEPALNTREELLRRATGLRA
jgi:tRNA nucleotidyltransferase (CCA-adding enzyme)